MNARTLAVRERVTARPEPPYDRLFDPLADDVLRGGPIARERFAVSWTDTTALRRLGEAKIGPLDPALAESLAAEHRRLGAPPESLAALDRLARGQAVAAVAGQQPAPLGGPLYALHKTASAIGLAAAYSERTGIPCVPLYWMHGEDSDFAEIRSILVGDRALMLHELALADGLHRAGALVGDLPVEPVAALAERALDLWAELPGAGTTAATLRAVNARAHDLGEWQSALLLALFGAHGLVVVDPRRPAFRAAARPVLDRYLADAGRLSAAARDAGARLEALAGRRPLADAALDSFVFAVEDGVRRKLGADEARAHRGPLSPSVALRPAVQDGVFPTVVMACGPGEIAYLAQLREVFDGVGVRAACPVPRFGATWLPPAAGDLIEACGLPAWEVVAAPDAAVRRAAEAAMPAHVREAFDRARAETNAGLLRFADASRAVDPSLPQMVESARGKVDFQFARLAEGLSAKLRHQLDRRRPEWVRLRAYLTPNEKLQERRLSSLEPLAWRGGAVAADVVELAHTHARRLADGVHEHALLELA